MYNGAELAYRVELPVLGIPVRFESNSTQVIEEVRTTFGVWDRMRAHADLLETDVARVRLFVHEGEEEPGVHAPLHYRCPRPDRLVVSTRGSFGVAEIDRLESYAFVTPQLVADGAHFRYGVVQALTLMLLTGRDRHPVHAATVARDGVALLLVGRSATGKSTVSYAAARAGLAVMGEDVAYVQLRPELRVWALPGRIHLSEDAPQHFPELGDREATLQANGKTKFAIDPHPEEDVPLVASQARVCLLSRDGGAVRLESIGPDEIQAALTERVESGFDRYADDIDAAAAKLAHPGGWRLHLSSDPAESVPLLQEMFDAIGNGAPDARG
jgi:hypothetical protein